MLEGTVIEAAGGFFTVRADSGPSYYCRARGMLKHKSAALIVGDRILFNLSADKKIEPGPVDEAAYTVEGIIEKKLPRRNVLTRPRVANIDQLVVVMAFKSPDCDWQLVNRMLVLAEYEGLNSILCLNKSDLLNKDELGFWRGELGNFPYPCIFTSAATEDGLEELGNKLSGCSSVFAGPSGAGKSSLLNAIQPGLSLQTGLISDKIKRGRHTTRQARLLMLENGGAVVDTPGFSRLDFAGISAEDLGSLFPEMESLRGNCAFRNCLHVSEPDCAIIAAVGKTINRERYEHYKYFIKELLS